MAGSIFRSGWLAVAGLTPLKGIALPRNCFLQCVWIAAPLISGCQHSETAPQKETAKTVASATTLSRPTAGASCLAAIQGLDIGKQVKSDIDQGETRFFILISQEPPANVAPGIKHCLYSQWKTIRPNEVAGFPLSGNSILQKCDAAIVNYMIDYNRALAKKFPDSTKLNCIG